LKRQNVTDYGDSTLNAEKINPR